MEDLKDERVALVKAINQNRFWEAVYAESFVARSESPREVCLDEVRKSHVYIGIFKSRYGYIPENKNNNPRGVSVVVLEYEEAKRNQIQIIILICKNASNREPHLEEFLRKLTDFDSGHWRKEYETIDELVQFALESINYELTKAAVEKIESKRKEQINSIYNLPFFKRTIEKFQK